MPANGQRTCVWGRVDRCTWQSLGRLISAQAEGFYGNMKRDCHDQLTALGARVRSDWGRASAPTSATRASAKNVGERRYVSITVAGASAWSAWGRASAPTSAARTGARTADAMRRIRLTGDYHPVGTAYHQLLSALMVWSKTANHFERKLSTPKNARRECGDSTSVLLPARERAPAH
jgi:hypothetical protein